jgi:hypothetical protein
MSLFDKVNGQPQMDMQQLQQDPVGAAQKAGYNIPPTLAGNAQAMVQHLLQTGQIGPQQFQQLIQKARSIGGRF